MYYSFADQTYFPWLELLVRSIRRCDPTTPILVQFSGDIEAARTILGDVPALRIEPAVHAIPAGGSGAELMEARSRNWLSVAQDHDFEWLMIMDADLLVRSSLAPLIRPMELYDYAAVIRGATDGGALAPPFQVSAALHIVTKRGLPILEETVRLIHGDRTIRGAARGDWLRDQACFAEAVLTSDLRIRSIPREVYLSSRPFDPEAAIWNANFSGDRKSAAMLVFRREFERLQAECGLIDQ